MKKSEENLWELWDSIQRNNICLVGIPEGEEEEERTESIFKAIMAENCPNLWRKMNI